MPKGIGGSKCNMGRFRTCKNKDQGSLNFKDGHHLWDFPEKNNKSKLRKTYE